MGLSSIWPHAFQLRYEIVLSASGLSTAFHLTNTGDAALSFAAALHTYFAVPDVTAVRVLGLRGLKYALPRLPAQLTHSRTAAASECLLPADGHGRRRTRVPCKFGGGGRG